MAQGKAASGARASIGDVAPKLADITEDILFGDIWERPQLSKRDRSLVTCAALAWLLRRSPVMLPIPGTSKVQHLEANVKSAELALTDEEYRMLDVEGRKTWERQARAVAAG